MALFPQSSISRFYHPKSHPYALHIYWHSKSSSRPNKSKKERQYDRDNECENERNVMRTGIRMSERVLISRIKKKTHGKKPICLRILFSLHKFQTNDTFIYVARRRLDRCQSQQPIKHRNVHSFSLAGFSTHKHKGAPCVHNILNSDPGN